MGNLVPNASSAVLVARNKSELQIRSIGMFLKMQLPKEKAPTLAVDAYAGSSQRSVFTSLGSLWLSYPQRQSRECA